MIIIEENKSNKLPNITSLFVKVPFNKTIIEQLDQQQIINYDKKTGIYELPITRLFFLINLLIKFDDVKFIAYKEVQKQIVSYNDYKFKVKPYSYQLEGIEYGLNHKGWLLLDEQGLGKTLQMIYLAEILNKREGLKHCFIICGVNGLKYNWAREIEKFSKLDYIILGQYITKRGKTKICSVAERCKQLKNGIKEFFVITNIETLQSREFAEAFNKSKSEFGMIVLDEAHRTKNPTSLSAKTLLKLKSNRNIALTGTMVMNNPENAYLPLKWTNNLNCTYGAFKNMYNVYGGFGGVQVIGYKNLELLQEHISTCSLRRLKSSVLDLPAKTYQIEYVEMGNKQQILYDEVQKGIIEELDKLPNEQMTIIQEMTINMRLRQVTACPSMLTTDNIPSAKLDRLEELVEDITAQGDKVVVFCTFKGTIPELSKRLKKYNPLVCTGDVSDVEIDGNKDKFERESKYQVMICTWQKMGTGHTLTSANYAIFVDTPWTDADFQQCSDRIYRIGQSKPVFIITLITKDTYDERVQEIIDKKEMLSGYLIDKVDSNLTRLIDFE